MSGNTSAPAAFRNPDDEQELARLRRLTGLEFDAVPESLIHTTGNGRKKLPSPMPAAGTGNRSQNS